LGQPGTAGISVGLQYFPLPSADASQCSTLCVFDSDCGPSFCGRCTLFVCSGVDSCDVAGYSNPAVEIAPLPGAGTALIASLHQQTPSGGTPTSAALDGAIQHAKNWAKQHPTHVTINVFATDGDPSDCDTDQKNIENLAAAGAK